MGAFLLALIVGVFSASPFVERDVAYAQTQDDNRLRSLSITGVSLSPGFNRDTTTYSARVPAINITDTDRTVEVRATTSNNDARVDIGTVTQDSTNTITQSVTVTVGQNNSIDVIVTPEMGGTAQPYTINVYVYRLNADTAIGTASTLGSLALRAGAGNTTGTDLISDFMDDTAQYNARVNHDIEKVTLVASATDAGAIVQVGSIRYNQSIISEAPRNIDLNGKGSKTEIRLIVTPEDSSSSSSYTITVYRERATLSSDNNLRNLSLGSGITLTFSSSKTEYTARVRNSVDHATVTSTLSDRAGGASASRTAPNPADGETPDSRPVSGDQVELTAGAETTITVTVTAEDGSTKDYTIKVYRENYGKSDVKTLGTLTVHPGTVTTGTVEALDPAFVQNMSSPDMFTTAVDNDVSSVTVTATPTHIGAMRSITPADASSGSAGHQLNLTAGAETTITVTVTAEDGSTKDYTIKVYRSASTESRDNTLKSLTVTGLNSAGGSTTAIFTPTIPRLVNNAATINVRVRNATSHVTFKATGHPAAELTIPEETALTPGEVSSSTLTVSAEDANVTDSTYTIRVYRERAEADRSADKTLEALALTGGTPAVDQPLAPTLIDDADASMRNATVANGVSSVRVTATPTDDGAMRSITPADASSGSVGHQVNLNAGAVTTITVTVTAEDGSTKDYTIKVFRMRSLISDNATLGSLTVTDGSGAAQTLDPAFSPSKTNYKVRMANSVDEITIVTETAVVGATIFMSDVPDDDPTIDGSQVFLSAGLPRVFTIIVRAENDTDEKTYTITLYRERATLSDNANLASLTLDAGTDTFSSSKTDYRVVVGNGLGSVTVSANVADVGADLDIMPADTDSNVAGHQVSLTVGAETNITVTVTAEDGSTTKTYTVVVYRERAPKSDDATLSALTLDGAMLSPAFTSNVMTYTARAAYSSDEVTLSYTPDLGAMSIVVRGGRPSSDLNMVSMSRSSATVRLYTTGETQIEITVMAEDESTKKYTITVSRASELSSDATLSSLMLSDVTLMPEFASGTMEYTAMVANDVEMTTVSATTAHPGATVEGTGMRTLTVGENVISVTVTAEDETTEIYTVTVTVLDMVTPEGTLLDRYDADDSGDIDLSEVSAAIDDYFNDDLTLDEVERRHRPLFRIEKKDHKEYSRSVCLNCGRGKCRVHRGERIY